MTTQTLSQLDKKKKSLSILFTGLLAITLLSAELIFVGVRFYRHHQIIEDVFSFSLEQVKQLTAQTNRGIVKRGPRQLLPIQFIVYTSDGRTLTNLFDGEFAKDVISTVEASNIKKDHITTISIENNNFYVYKRQDAEGLYYLISPNDFPTNSILLELFLFIILLLITTTIIYFLMYKLISSNLSTVELAIQDMEDFTHNAGHELKTPLSVASAALQLANVATKPQDYIQQALFQLKKMALLIDNLLILSTLTEQNKESVDLWALISDYLLSVQPKIQAKEINTLNTVKTTKILANQQHLEIVIRNILNNAITYNKQGGTITCSYSDNTLEVRDTGVGIPQEELESIFTLFHQVNTARNQEWYGIWLSLVKKICELNKWQISISSQIGLWTSVKIKFQ